VKRIIHGYFLQFSSQHVVAYIRTHRLKLSRIPPPYRQLGNNLATFSTLPSDAVAPLYRIPTRTRPGMIEHLESRDIWGCRLEYRAEPYPWSEEQFSQLGPQSEELKKQIGMIISNARIYIRHLSLVWPEVSGLGLNIRTDDMSMVLSDSNFPDGGTAPGCLTTRVWKMAGPEIDAVMRW
jgi:hypothetical protein